MILYLQLFLIFLGVVPYLYGMQVARKAPLAVTNNSTYNLIVTYRAPVPGKQSIPETLKRIVAPEEDVWLGNAEDIKELDYDVYGKVFGTVSAVAQAAAAYITPKQGAAINVAKAYQLRKGELASGNSLLGFNINMSTRFGVIPSFSDTYYVRVLSVGKIISLPADVREKGLKDDQAMMSFLAQPQLFPGLRTRGAILRKLQLKSPEASRYILGLPDTIKDLSEVEMAYHWTKEKVRYLPFESEDLRNVVQTYVTNAYHTAYAFFGGHVQAPSAAPQTTPSQILKETEEAFKLTESM